MADVFISHAQSTRALTSDAASALRGAGFSVWWDEDLPVHRQFAKVIEENLDAAKAVLVIWSADALESDHVRDEAEVARVARTLVQVTVGGTVPPLAFRQTQYADLTGWRGDVDAPAWRKVVASVGELVGARAAEPQSSRPAHAATSSTPDATFATSRDGISVPATPPPRPSRLRAVSWLAAGVVAAVVVGGVGWRLARAPSDAGMGVTQTARKSVAVVPFANLTGDVAKDYVGDGLAEELIDALAHVDGLKVPARTSSFAYKGRSVDIRHIGRDLGVETILEGSVRSAGDRIRVTAQLVDAESGYHIWSQTYDRRTEDLLALEDELSAAIVQALLGTMVGGQAARPVSPPTRDPEAYRLYVQAQLIQNSIEGAQHARELLDEAVGRDPAFARAYVARGDSRVGGVAVGVLPASELTIAEADANSALGLDPRLASAHATLAQIDALRGRWSDAERRYKDALALDPSDTEIQASYAIGVLAPVGKVRAALDIASAASRAAPAIKPIELALINFVAGREAEATRMMNLSIEMGALDYFRPFVLARAVTAAHLGHFDAAVGGARILLPEDDTETRHVVETLFAGLADPRQRQPAIASARSYIEKVGPAGMVIEAQEFFIWVLVSLGDVDHAFDFARQCLDEFRKADTVGPYWAILWSPDMRPFRQHPRFVDFASRLGLVDYWKAAGQPDDCALRGGELDCR